MRSVYRGYWPTIRTKVHYIPEVTVRVTIRVSRVGFRIRVIRVMVSMVRLRV